MSNFNYSQYQEVIARAQNGAEGGSNGVKIGFFKLKDNGHEALIRINAKSLDDLQFATVHQLGAAQKWMKVSCLNPVGSYQDTCPLCAAVAGGNTGIGRAAKKVYVQMLVSYKDPATQQFSAPIPVIWERPAGFSTEIANLLRDYGDLTQKVFKVTRNGAAGNMQTTYSISYIPIYDKPETLSADFSAFTNFNIAKHSFWEKTLGEINVFLNTGAFPEVVRSNQAPMPTDADAPSGSYAAPAYADGVQITQGISQVPPIYTAAPSISPDMSSSTVAASPIQETVVPASVGPIANMPANTATAAMPGTPTPEVNIPKVEPNPTTTAQPVGIDFGRAPRTFGGLSF